MKSIGSIFIVLMLAVVVFYGVQVIGENSSSNPNLDHDSKALISNFTNNLNDNFDVTTDFNEFDSNLSDNSSFDSQDVFAQEFLEGKSEGTKKQGIVSKITKIPDMVILSLGVPEDSVAWIKGILALVLTTFLGFAAYRAIYGGGKITDN